LRFPDWEGPLKYVRDHYQEGDVVMTIYPHAIDFVMYKTNDPLFGRNWKAGWKHSLRCGWPQRADERMSCQMVQQYMTAFLDHRLDCEEQALDAEEQGIGFSVLELTSRTVHGIETALRRLAAGQLGTCSDCRCRISDARLRALPFAALCLACQERHDLAAGWRGRAASARTGALGQ
jgi:RNA polymerase-binding transcription factor DksA